MVSIGPQLPKKPVPNQVASVQPTDSTGNPLPAEQLQPPSNYDVADPKYKPQNPTRNV